MLTRLFGVRGAGSQWFLVCLSFLVLTLGIPIRGAAQDTLAETTYSEFMSVDHGTADKILEPGAFQVWSLQTPPGGFSVYFQTNTTGVTYSITHPDGQAEIFEIDSAMTRLNEFQLDVTADWIVVVENPTAESATYHLSWIHNNAFDAGPVDASTQPGWDQIPDPAIEPLPEGYLPPATAEEYANGRSDAAPFMVNPGAIQTWNFRSPAGWSYVVLSDAFVDMRVVLISPEGQETELMGDPEWGRQEANVYTETGGDWTVFVHGPTDAGTSYRLLWAPDSVFMDSEDSFGAEEAFEWGDDSWSTGDDWSSEGMDDPFGQSNPGGFGGFSGFNTPDPANLLEGAMAYGARVVFPFFALKSVQAITIFFVLSLMMKPSSKTAAVETLETPDAPPAPTATNEGIHFHERHHLDEVSRKSEARRHLHRLNKANAFSFWWLLIVNVVFSLATLIAFGPGVVPLVQVVVVWLAYGLFLLIGRNLGPIMGLLMGLPTLIFPLLMMARGGMSETQFVRGIGVWAIYFTCISLIVLFSRRKAARFAKQDLLVLRVFGMDRAASETFSTIARAWSFLGASATIADPSYVKFQFSGMRGNLWKFFLIGLATALAAWASTKPMVQDIMPQSLSVLQRDSILTMLAFVILIPFAVVPVFLSVRMNFVKSLDKLIDRIQALLGHKRRPDGYHRRHAFFCHDDLWRPAIMEMMKEAEVLLLDFRGFDAKNLGCAYEVGKVLDNKPIDRAVLLVDEKTDTAALYDIFRSCWAKIPASSPNAGTDAPELKVYIASAPVSWRDGIFRWIFSFLFLSRNRQWKRDSRGVMALLSTAAAEPLPGGDASPA